ncbi:MAG: TCR/Tet family MFS transporter [bacterium]|nr:MFS transporter [Gammaproteobacteria bacterium]
MQDEATNLHEAPVMINRAAIAFVFTTSLINSIGFGIMLPVLPELIMQITGDGLSTSARYGGWLAVSFAVMQFLFAPTIGNLSDRYGRRSVLLVSLFVVGINYLLMGFATSLVVLFVGRIISGIGSSTNSTVNAYIADIVPVSKRAEYFGYMGAAFGLGFIIGPLIGGLLGGFSPRLPFHAAAGLSFANMLFGFFLLPESLAADRRRPFEWSRANPIGTLVALWHYPRVIGIVLVIFLFNFAMMVMPNTWSFFTVERYQWTATEIGYSLAVIGVLMIIVQTVVNRWMVTNLGLRVTGTIGFVAMIISFIGYAFAAEAWMLFVAMIPGALGQLCGPATQGMATAQVDHGQQGELQGGIASAIALTSIVSPVTMTETFAYFASAEAPVYFPGAAFILSAVICVIALGLFIRVTRPMPA